MLVVGFTLLVVALVFFMLFSPEAGDCLLRSIGLPGYALPNLLWRLARWAIAFVAVMLALDVFYYTAPYARLPFRWTPRTGSWPQSSPSSLAR